MGDASGQMPDIVQGQFSHLYKYAAEKLIIPLDDLLKKHGQDMLKNMPQIGSLFQTLKKPAAHTAAAAVLDSACMRLAFRLISSHTEPWSLRRLPFAAITFGHVVVALSGRQLAVLRAHEHVHVRQYEVLGALFFPAYALASLVALARRRSAYAGNAFEVQACRKCGSAGVPDV